MPLPPADARQISVVGRVSSVAEATTHCTYVIDDGTGRIDVKQWIDDGAVAEDVQQLNEKFVRVFGQLKEFNGKRSIGANSIKRVDDYNEVQFHLLEATYVHLVLTRGALHKPDEVMGGTAVPEYDVKLEHRLDVPASELARRVYELISASMNDFSEGLNVSTIEKKLNLNTERVNEAIGELLELGKLYSTVDEYTYAIMC